MGWSVTVSGGWVVPDGDCLGVNMPLYLAIRRSGGIWGAFDRRRVRGRGSKGSAFVVGVMIGCVGKWGVAQSRRSLCVGARRLVVRVRFVAFAGLVGLVGLVRFLCFVFAAAWSTSPQGNSFGLS